MRFFAFFHIKSKACIFIWDNGICAFVIIYLQQIYFLIRVKINNKNIVYIDGHYDISSSNHYRMVSYLPLQTSFASSLLSCLAANRSPFQVGCNLCSLNDEPNFEGFTERYDRGKKSGQAILNKIVSGEIKIKRDALGRILGKIDIVAHSMGYAHAKGILDFLKPYLAVGNTFGNFYVIAPENAIGHSTSIEPVYRLNVGAFESVFQYGSNFDVNNSGLPFEQNCRRDGVAPQIGINGLNRLNNIFIPTNSNYRWMRNFIDAHNIENYNWLFTEELIPLRARIKKRN